MLKIAVQHTARMKLLKSYFPKDLAKMIYIGTISNLPILPDIRYASFNVFDDPITGDLTTEKIVNRANQAFAKESGNIIVFNHDHKELVAMSNFDGSLIVKPMVSFYKDNPTQFPKSYLRQGLNSYLHSSSVDYILFESRRETVKAIGELLRNLKYQNLREIFTAYQLGQNFSEDYLLRAWLSTIDTLYYYVSSITKPDGKVIKLIIPGDDIYNFIMLTLEHELISTYPVLSINVDPDADITEIVHLPTPEDCHVTTDVMPLDYYLSELSRLVNP